MKKILTLSALAITALFASCGAPDTTGNPVVSVPADQNRCVVIVSENLTSGGNIPGAQISSLIELYCAQVNLPLRDGETTQGPTLCGKAEPNKENGYTYNLRPCGQAESREVCLIGLKHGPSFNERVDPYFRETLCPPPMPTLIAGRQ